MSRLVEVIHVESWRADSWDEDVPSREGWQVQCAVHGPLGSPPGWAYGRNRDAEAMATRHRRTQHAEPELTALVDLAIGAVMIGLIAFGWLIAVIAGLLPGKRQARKDGTR